MPAECATETPHVYSVPQRFGLISIFGLTTLMALLFGVLRSVEAHPAIYFCLSVTTLAICLVQMFHGQFPRVASTVTGAIALPASLAVAAWFWEIPSWESGCELGCCAVFGLLVGYLGGACLAGIFLVQDMIERQLARRRLQRQQAALREEAESQ